MLTLDCAGAECKSFTCQMGPFADKNKVAKIELNMIINVTRIMEQVGIPDTVDIISEGSLTILDETEFTHYVKQQPKQATCGFFRRQAKEDLERSKRESLAASSAPHSPTTEAVPSIPSDDPEVRSRLLNAEDP
ncbi:hypothetical protein HPB50_008327 [Hyalomma asiaticum]|uniref:Uncharacterized protein n=1 Tax=Hyalomma asiaticum TaxID=266040 RepID=A0ACB7SUK0_HYAAI|nr:hypothetical protein HPB50_008327 [Hyalomma asiaticum]